MMWYQDETSPQTAVRPPVTSASADVSESETQTFQTTELDLPESTAGILLLLGGLLALAAITVRTSLRDSRFLKRGPRILLLVPRLVVLLILLAILLNPQRRTQLSRIEKSRVGIAIDTSLSMQWPARDAASVGQPSGSTEPASDSADAGKPPVPESAGIGTTGPTRSEAVMAELMNSGLLAELSQRHLVTIYTFDSTLSAPAAVVTDEQVRFPESAETPVDAPAADGKAVVSLDQTTDAPDTITSDASLRRWQALLQPRGAETRLGESVYQLIGQLSGRTLSGLVVITDGRNNSGLDVEAARLRAERSGTKLISVGTGSLKPQMNLWISGMQAPADVHQGDPFDVTVLVSGSHVSGSEVNVRLYQRTAGGDHKDQQELPLQSIKMENDGIPRTLRFSQSLNVPGKYEYVARVESADGSVEMTTDDNERRRTVEVTDRRMRILVISSGPMRDYQFVRNTLFRHSGVESDVWLQSVTDENVAMVSQEARRLLTKFPATEAELFDYDVVVAFDPDWSRLTAEQQTFLNRWVAEHSGGLIVVAGEIFTPRLAQNPDAMREISVLYPVLLNRMAPEMNLTQGSDEPRQLVLTPQGAATEFLKIADESGNASTELWTRFKGIFRSYPVRGIRDGAVVLIHHNNPRAQTELGFPPFMVSQFFGTGRTMFLGSAETWRLRELSPQGHQRLWTSLIREVGQGRRSRGTARGLLMLDRTETSPGQPVTIRAQLYDAELKPLNAEMVLMTIQDGAGQPLSVPDRLNSDGRGLGQFNTSFRPPAPGLYTISLPIPESTDTLTATLDVVLPNLEAQEPAQDVDRLRQMARDTQGTYLSLSELAKLPDLLPDQSQPVIVDEQLRTLWDRSWMMYLAVGLLSAEWALRRVWRLS